MIFYVLYLLYIICMYSMYKWILIRSRTGKLPLPHGSTGVWSLCAEDWHGMNSGRNHDTYWCLCQVNVPLWWALLYRFGWIQHRFLPNHSLIRSLAGVRLLCRFLLFLSVYGLLVECGGDPLSPSETAAQVPTVIGAEVGDGENLGGTFCDSANKVGFFVKGFKGWKKPPSTGKGLCQGGHL